MAAINTTQQLAKVRTKIDVQQQIINRLELDLQRAILGDATVTVPDILADINASYAGVPEGAVLTAAVETGLEQFQEAGTLVGVEADQTVLRQMLYQARTMLGELRIEEQQYNTEVQEEKSRRKDLNDFAKG
jgi:hypothetical protein